MFDPVAYAASLLVIVTSCGLAVWIAYLRGSHRSIRDAEKGLMTATLGREDSAERHVADAPNCMFIRYPDVRSYSGISFSIAALIPLEHKTRISAS